MTFKQERIKKIEPAICLNTIVVPTLMDFLKRVKNAYAHKQIYYQER